MRDAERVIEITRQSLQAKGVNPTKDATMNALAEMVVIMRRGFSSGLVRCAAEKPVGQPIQEIEPL
jgi:hypothetical protein